MATDTEGAAAQGMDGGAEAGATGLPQLDFSTFPNQIFWLVVTLLAIYYILTRIALPRIASVLAERSGSITNDLAAAEDLKAKAAEAEKAYEKALADARAEAQKIIGEAKAEIQADVDAATRRADAEIAEKTAESEKAIAEIRENAAQSVQDVARDTVGAVLSAVGADADDAEIEKALAARAKGA
ncbi:MULTISPECIES: F0F1 ATP synthase subunit B' [unclassified Rhodosalinus]|uniref:F0F1 ATP synthase subunit B' n=1 Tax=unclassified Rhodosalinus TaxID=2630183 RepID=UPI003526344A